MASTWTNEAAIEQWNAATTRAAMEAAADYGDVAKHHLVNPVLLRMLGDVRGQRVLDAGCGNGYFSWMLARRGAQVVGIEPTNSMSAFARGKEAELTPGISYVQADLTQPPELGEPFDAVGVSAQVSR